MNKILQEYPLHTDKQMAAVVRQARNAPSKTAAEAILKANGLHNIWVCYHNLYSSTIILFDQFQKECILEYS